MRDHLETLRELVAKQCDDGLSSQERDMLNDLLRTSPALRREYASLMDVHAALIMHPDPSSSLNYRSPSLFWNEAPLRWAIAAAVILAMVLLVVPRDRNAAGDSHFATLIRATHCQWQGRVSPLEGEPLGESDLRLSKGIALIRFSNGVEISLLAPSHLEITGPNAASLREGELYFSNDMSDSGVQFSLSTPGGQLLDIGTSYSVAVSTEGIEEIHVEDGKVIRVDKRDQEVTIKSGHAMRWQEKGPGESILFVQMPRSYFRAAQRAEQEKPTAWYSFVDREGFGFSEDWMRWGYNANNSKDLEETFTAKGFQPESRTVIAAPLKVPIDMSRNDVTYFSLFCSIDAASTIPKNFYMAFRESSTPDHKAEFVVTPRRLSVGAHLLYSDDDAAGRSTMALALPRDGSEFQLAGKIVSRANEPDQLFLRILPEHEPLDADEPFAWTVVGRPIPCDFRFDLLSLHLNVEGIISIQNFNLGKTWESATKPQKR